MSSKETSIFYSIGSQRCSAVRIKKHGSSLLLANFASRTLAVESSSEHAREAQVTAVIDELADELDLQKNEQVRILLSAQNVYTKWVPVPVLENRSDAEVIEMEARQAVPFSLDSVCWGYWHGKENEAQSDEALIAAVRKEQLDQIAASFDSAGLQMDVIELSPFALANAFRYNYPEVKESVLLIDLGARVTSLIFLEGDKMYLRTPTVGGMNLTTQIGKEFGLDVVASEALKKEKGLVGLGGVVVSEDEEQDALSKVLRNGMTRLHSEITRTLSVWRSQKGGSLPTKIYLAGGGAALPYTLEFLQEKLGLPVEYFQAVKNVAVSDSVSAEQTQSIAYLAGDLVGAAVGEYGLVDEELVVLPEAVAARKDFERRQPFLVGAVALLALGFLLLIGANLLKKQKFDKAAAANKATVNEVTQSSNQIGELMSGQGGNEWVEEGDGYEVLADLTKRYGEMVDMRSYWVELLQDFNESFNSDVVWITRWEPQVSQFDSFGQMVVSSSTGGSNMLSRDGGELTAGITHVEIQGLYRGGNQQTVYEELEDLKMGAAAWFSFVDEKGENIEFQSIEPFDVSESYGASFEIHLPLVRPVFQSSTGCLLHNSSKHSNF